VRNRITWTVERRARHGDAIRAALRHADWSCKQDPEYRAKISRRMKAIWAERRAAKHTELR
jgi:hypothetical protein